MIDNKKIEEAAKQHAEKAFISGYWQACYKEGFMGCAKWMQEEFLKDLWHSDDEEPKLGKRVLVKINGNLSLFNSGFVVEHLRNFDDHYGIESWLYIDDLFPKEGGEQ